jgi:hypothetical protein
MEQFTPPGCSCDPRADGGSNSGEGKCDASCAVSFFKEVRRDWGVARENVLSIIPNKPRVLEFLAVCEQRRQLDAKAFCPVDLLGAC